jgi:hypothetical protein
VPPSTTSTTTPGPSTTAPIVGRVEGEIWIDLDRNGVHDPGEAPLPGVTVVLEATSSPAPRTSASLQPPSVLRAAGAAAPSAAANQVTAADGTYAFESVAPGSYQVRADLAVTGIQPWWDTDGSSDWQIAITVPVGTARADLAAVGNGLLQGTVTQDGSVAVVANAPVVCTWSGLDGILGTGDDARFEVTADAGGAFRLDGAPFGAYRCVGRDPVSGRTSAPTSGEVGSGTPTVLDVPIAQPQPPTDGELPRTGSSPVGKLVVAAWLLAGGTFCLLAGRLRSCSLPPGGACRSR